MEELAAYIASEMNTNIHHPSVLKMKELLSYDIAGETRKQMALPWYAQIGATSPQAIAASKGAAAMALFTERVGEDRPWDHKPILAEKYNGVVYHKQGDYDYYYDIWSNIHYGYVGRTGGLSESILLDGAGAEQIVSDTLRKVAEVLKKPKEERNSLGPIARATSTGSVHGTTPPTGLRSALG
ncbi:putative RNase toxin 44 of polymorphic toxin system [Pseudomonas sp. OV226]|nr:putative RNase toxin 44 of polymorphic toxin system [Pseudomonas sp. OV226]